MRLHVLTVPDRGGLADEVTNSQRAKGTARCCKCLLCFLFRSGTQDASRSFTCCAPVSNRRDSDFKDGVKKFASQQPSMMEAMVLDALNPEP